MKSGLRKRADYVNYENIDNSNLDGMSLVSFCKVGQLNVYRNGMKNKPVKIVLTKNGIVKELNLTLVLGDGRDDDALLVRDLQ